MKKYFIPFASLLALSACAYAFDKNYQDVEIITPGANNAICYLYADGVRYRYKPPQTIKIEKSKEDLVVHCDAPGNRSREVVIKPGVSDSSVYNMANLGVGYAWDITSGAYYAYPERIYVDFSNMPTRPEDLPAQNQPDIKPPEAYNFEEFSHEEPRLNSDKYIRATPIQIRQPQPPIFNQVIFEEPSLDDVEPLTMEELGPTMEDPNAPVPLTPELADE